MLHLETIPIAISTAADGLYHMQVVNHLKQPWNFILIDSPKQCSLSLITQLHRYDQRQGEFDGL